MKRSIGLVRHGWEAKSSARLQAATVAPPYTASLVPRPARALHISAHPAYPFPSLRTQAEHSLEPATPSTSRATNPPPPPPPSTSTSTSTALGKKRSSVARSTGSAQVRPGKDTFKSVQTSEEKRPHPPTQSLQETSPKVEEQAEARRQSTTSKADPSTSSANPETQLSPSSSKMNSTSTTSGNEPEPPRTLLERIKGLWENVKYLFRFYYQGTKQIWKDRAIVADLRKKVADRNAETGEGLRWIENAVIQQHESDLGKLPLFLAILLILEEILPLVVIYAPSLLPSTCILPSQNAKMRSSEERLRGLAIQDLAKNDAVRRLVDELVSSQASSAANVKAKNTEEEVSAELSVAELGPDVGKQVSSLFALSTWGPSTMRNLRIQRHLNTVEEDDELLLNAFKTRTTTSQWKDICQSDWLAKACARRGLRAFEADAKAMESNLITYLHLASGNLHINQRALLPLALYDGTMQDLVKLQGEANEEQSKGLRQRTNEVVQEVKEAEKQKEAR